MAEPQPAQDAASIKVAIGVALAAIIRATRSLPPKDIAFHRSMDPVAAKLLNQQQQMLLSLTETLLKTSASSNATVPSLARSKEDVVDTIDSAWKDIVEILDGLLEKTDASLDAYKSLVKLGEKHAQEFVLPFPASPTLTGNATTVAHPVSYTAPANNHTASNASFNRGVLPKHNGPKPQEWFHVPVRNDLSGPFKPLLTNKPNAIVPFDQSFRLEAINSQTNEPDYINPYSSEIARYTYPTSMLHQTPPRMYEAMERSRPVWVDTEDALFTMIAELKQAKEIAVDLEHHDSRSYIGIVCLMQISTRNKDWIIDTLKPWRHKLECLNYVFADPNILKVLHGASSDIVWLQRDFGVYIVGLFDTYHVCRALRYPQASLAFLLKKFCNFDAQKQYQMADWRVRPVISQMLEYARSDTHFLLYIFDCLRNALLTTKFVDHGSTSLMNEVLVKSKDTSLQRYEYPVADKKTGLGAVGWWKLLSKLPPNMSKEEFAIFRDVHAWRDGLARITDESPNFVLANHSLFALAREKPIDKTGLFHSIIGMSNIVRYKLDALVDVISYARKNSSNDKPMSEVMAESGKIVDSRRDRRFAATHKARLPSITSPVSVPPQSPPNPSVLSSTTTAPQTHVAVAAVPTSIDSPITTPHLSAQPPKPTNDIQQSTTTPSSFPILRSFSSFWGRIADLPPCTHIANSSLSLTVPLPNLTAEVFAPMNGEQSDANQQDLASTLEPKYIAPEQRHTTNPKDDVFIIKQLGGQSAANLKRKHDSDRLSAAASDIDSCNETNLPDRTAQAQRDKKKAKRERQKEDKKRRASEPGETDNHSEGEIAEFDYTSTPSLLHGASSRGGGGVGFDMYSKAMNAPKGLGRSGKPRAGVMSTFKLKR